MKPPEAILRTRRALIECARVAVIAGLFLIKLPLQLVGCVKGPEIFIDSLDDNRYAVYLAISLASEFVIEVRIKDLIYFYRYLPFTDFLFRLVVLLPGKEPAAPRVLSRESKTSFPSKQQILIDGDYYSPPKRAATSLIMPYFAHPKFYRERLHLKASAASPLPRPMRIFFCGSVEKEKYGRCFLFPILNRSQIMEYILEHFSDHIANSMQAPKMEITMLITSDTRDIVEKHPFSPAKFFQALTKADFFIAPPGWVMPHSHNIIEAMTAGSIPITNYAHLFDPPLQSGTNCLSFASYQDLDRVLWEAINMPAEKVEFMRKETLEYYQRHLRPSAFGAKFRRCWLPSTPVLVNQERTDYAIT